MLLHWNWFWFILAVGWIMIFAQAIFSLSAGCLTQNQLHDERGITNGYAFLEHGGIRYDFIITAEVAAILAHYNLALFSRWGWLTLLMCIIGWGFLDRKYQEAGKITPEAHTLSYGARIIHLLFAIFATWVNVRFYFTAVVPAPSMPALLVTSLVLTPFFYMGVKKFNPQWKFSTQDKWQVGILTVGLWVLTMLKLAA